MVVEMYPRLITGAVQEGECEARAEYLRRRREEDAAYAAQPRRVLEKARGSEDAFDALVSVHGDDGAAGGICAAGKCRRIGVYVEGWTGRDECRRRY